MKITQEDWLVMWGSEYSVDLTELPKWANWLAIDQDGDMWCYKNEPKVKLENWDSGGRAEPIEFYAAGCKWWKESLWEIQREQSKQPITKAYVIKNKAGQYLNPSRQFGDLPRILHNSNENNLKSIAKDNNGTLELVTDIVSIPIENKVTTKQENGIISFHLNGADAFFAVAVSSIHENANWITISQFNNIYIWKSEPRQYDDGWSLCGWRGDYFQRLSGNTPDWKQCIHKIQR